MAKTLRTRSSSAVLLLLLLAAPPARAEEKVAVLVLGAEPSYDTLAGQCTEVLVAAVAQRTGVSLVGRDEFLARLSLNGPAQVETCLRELPCLARAQTLLSLSGILFGYLGGDEDVYRLHLMRVATDGKVEGQIRREMARQDELLLRSIKTMLPELYQVRSTELRVDCNIRGASVYLDERPVGTTPLVLAGVEPGLHRLRVEAPGHLTHQQALEVEDAGAQAKVLLVPVGPREEPVVAVSPSPTPASLPVSPPPAEASGEGSLVSRSSGVPGGVVVLWPRVIPRALTDSNRALIREIQTRLESIATRTLPGVPLDRRPEAERVCPQAGCFAISLGAVFTRREQGCAVLGLVGLPGPSPVRLVPWAGAVQLAADQSPFRSPPENMAVVKDFVPCDRLLESLAQKEGPLSVILKQVAEGQ